MQKFFDPKAVVAIGAPRKTGAGAFNNVECMLRYGYKGRIYPINPKAREICGLKAYPSVLEVPEVADLAVISVGRDRVISAFEQCIQAGIRRALIVSQGFADADEQGAKLQEKIVVLARENGVRVVGPNTMGVLNTFRNFHSGFVDLPVPKNVSHISVVTQTGVIHGASGDFSCHSWGKSIDIGNSCDVDFVDILEYYSDDPETKVIAIHIEGMKRGRDFLKTASMISLHKPIVAFKPGRSDAGAKAALSHTGSLVGEDGVFDAAFNRAGIIRVKDATELKDALHALILLQEMDGPDVAILTATGAGGIMAIDVCEEVGLRLAKLPQPLSEKLKSGMPEWIHIDNPVDIWAMAMIGRDYHKVIDTALTQLLNSPEVNGVLMIVPSSSGFPLHTDFNLSEVISKARRRADNRKPIAIWSYGDDQSLAPDQYEAIDGVATFRSVERAVRGLHYCHQYYNLRNRRIPAVRRFPFDRNCLDSLLKRGRGQKTLTGEDALCLLAAFGIPVVRGVQARGLEELEAGAADLTCPLVLKLADSRFLHKSEWGGVTTGIRDMDELRSAFHTIIENVHSRDPDVRIGAFHLQEQAEGSELLLGLKRDPQFGQVIACGWGGIYAEVFRDISREIVPVDRLQAEKMLKSLKTYPILEGVRGEAGVNMEALIEVMERLSFLATVVPDIAELDINPLFASSDGCRAADARILW